MNDSNNNENSIDEFEMGKDSSKPDSPSINNYKKEEDTPKTESIKEQINPEASAPPESSQQTQEPQQQAQQPQQQSHPPQQHTQYIQQKQRPWQGGQPQGAQQKAFKPKRKADPVARKKALLGCLGIFTGIMIILLGFSFFFIAIYYSAW